MSDIVYDFTLRHPPARVWAAITDPAKMAQWLMPNTFLPVLGHKFTFTRPPIPQVNFDGVTHCEVITLDPERCLEFTFVGGTLDTVVSFTITAVPEGTALHFEHRGFDLQNPVNAFSFTMMGGGWAALGKKLEDLA